MIPTQAGERFEVLDVVRGLALFGIISANMSCCRGRARRAWTSTRSMLDLPIGFAVCAAQVVTSRWWLHRFRYGPLEWVWRMLTYGEWLPLAKAA